MTTTSKLAEAERSISVQARKVLEVVPLAEAWSIQQVVAELKRLGQGSVHNVVLGCLASLKESGLVKEPSTGSFIRVSARPRVVAGPAGAEFTAASLPAPAAARRPVLTAVPSGDPLSKFGEISTGLRTQATQLQIEADLLMGHAAALNQAADEVDAAALDFDARESAAATDSAKLRQLSTLLQSIGLGAAA